MTCPNYFQKLLKNSFDFCKILDYVAFINGNMDLFMIGLMRHYFGPHNKLRCIEVKQFSTERNVPVPILLSRELQDTR